MRGATFAAALLAVALGLAARGARGQPKRGEAPPTPAAAGVLAGEEPAQGGALPELGEAPELGDLAGKPIVRVEVRSLGTRWGAAPAVTRVRVGEPLSGDAARRAIRELVDSGRCARASAEALAEGDGVLLRLWVLPRRLAARVDLRGGVLDAAQTLEAADLGDGTEITEPGLADSARRVRAFYAAHGFPGADAKVDVADTDDPLRVVVSIAVEPGPPETIARRVFVIEPAADKELGPLKTHYKIGAGARVDDALLTDADRDEAEVLRQHGFSRAQVHHEVRRDAGTTSRSAGAVLFVFLEPGPRLVPAFDGNHAFDADDLERELALAKGETKQAELVERVRNYYVARGFLDATVTVSEQGGPADPVHTLLFRIVEGRQSRVVRRVFPCLQGPVTANQLGEEIDSFLEEELPGADTFAAPDPNGVDAAFGPSGGVAPKPAPLPLVPAMTYAPDTYDRAVKHLRDLLHAKGYLNAVVGPLTVVRAACSKRSPAGACVPEPLPKIELRCAKDALGLPLPEPDVPDAATCQPDPKHDVVCSNELTVRIPVALGPQTMLYDVAFEGNHAFTEKDLAKSTELVLGDPLSNVDLEAARLRVLDLYKDRGYAYADVRVAIEPSPDRTRARARFSIVERDVVIVSGFVVKGATRTDEALILSRLALKKGGAYRQDDARTSEERVAALGTFSSVAIALEDADVPQRQKRVVLTVVEQLPQYLDPRIGFSTGEGIRFAFEYGHRNIAGQAIALTLSVQLSYLFDFMILDPAVRRNYEPLSVSQRLERRDTIGIKFPLSPKVALSLDGVDVRDNQRDFGLTKQSVGPTFTLDTGALLGIRMRRPVVAQVGGSVELNDVQIFAADTVEEAIKKNPSLAGLLRVPDGRTVAVAQFLKLAYDRRDSPFAARRGAFLSGGVEHVDAFPSNVLGNAATISSHFLRFTTRFAGYVPLTAKGASIAMEVRGGYNFQLTANSKTYPDRLFFLGGVDSVRAFLTDSLVPEDLAQKILTKKLKISDVAIRGGDLALNPRLELRIPLSELLALGIFLDTGNLWVDPAAVNIFALRYAAGPGLRFSTAIGPIALDYGINLDRRPWEDFGAFHFSIGLF